MVLPFSRKLTPAAFPAFTTISRLARAEVCAGAISVSLATTGLPSAVRDLRRCLHRILGEMGREKCGFHAFRRYRVNHLRKQRVPEDLLRFWIGHADGSVTDGYSKVKEDVEFRRIIAEQAGLGLHMPTVVPKLPVAPIAPKMDRIFRALGA